MVNNIKNKTISEIDAKKDLKTLNKIKKAEIIKNKKRTSRHKKLLNLSNDLSDIILTDKILKSESQKDKKEEEKMMIMIMKMKMKMIIMIMKMKMKK